MALIDRIKERTGSDLSDTELQDMIDAITADMDARFGPVGEFTVELGDPTDPSSRYLRTLKLPRPVDPAEPLTVTEIEPGNSGDASAAITLEAADYRLLHGGRTLQRLVTGPNGRNYWAPMVSVTFTPLGEQAARDEATIKLMQLDLSYRGGLKSEEAGDYKYTLATNMADEREAIFAGLAQRRGLVMA
ncbi:hypothetical protein [Novosphingobium sp. MBES04]|uniref:hypothetical protein n=1 Tax=Novosphingobium sp. MBES04 TaxID=1206458 RepID=UPI0005809A9A|nr:hypothetical protein [Novosphingobium sp. MBES04]GAM04813.1 hypothetical conserved protein [Novosphingobium sp. MBES04]